MKVTPTLPGTSLFTANVNLRPASAGSGWHHSEQKSQITR
jgi:hypothetical protein